jgi:lipopolysaccharide transport system ATP-binding protein
MSAPVISVQNLSKKYRIQHQAKGPGYLTLRDVIAEKAKASIERLQFGKRKGRGSDLKSAAVSNSALSAREDFWALKEVNFEVEQGEVVGLIGRNGAGKSTLLRILSRITEPTQGRVEIDGRVASLLEVGTGFHPELTGRENIFLNGAILGMTRRETRKKFDEIVDFAGVAKFLDTPVKRYSSGMYVRLAFAVAAHLEPEILLVDEVLAVGDAAFQEKCLGKMDRVAEEGRTVLIVSHNMSTIQQLCKTCILLRNGQIYKTGDPAEVVSEYLSDANLESDLDIRKWEDRRGSGEARLVRLTMADETGSPTSVFPFGGIMRFILEAEVYEALMDPSFGVAIHASSGEPILDLQSAHNGLRLGKVVGTVRIQGTFPNIGLYPGKYFLSPWIMDAGTQKTIDFPRMCCNIQIVPKPGEFGDLRLDPHWGKYWVSSVWKAIQTGRDENLAIPSPNHDI